MTLRPDIAQGPLGELLRREGLDSVEGVFAYGGGQDINKTNLGHRRRTRLELIDAGGQKHVLYLKRYRRRPLLQRLWSYSTSCQWADRLASAAFLEMRNVCAAGAAGVPTMQMIAMGQERALFGGGRSYLIVTAVAGDALERCGQEYIERNADNPAALDAFTAALAAVVRSLHHAGYVHRDLYASHVFLHEDQGRIQLYLIDLARMFRPRWRKFRWRVKDLAQLYYSMPPQWVDRQWDSFLRRYLSSGDGEPSKWRRAIERKAAAIARRASRKANAVPCDDRRGS